MNRPSFSRGLACLALLAASCSAQPPRHRWLINETASLPRGLYRAAPGPPRTGDIVALRPTPGARGYLQTLGAKPDARLLKRVAAGPGDVVCRQGVRVRWPRGEVLARHCDRRGAALPTWRGCRRLGPHERFVLGDTPQSFDGRYFGPTPVGDIAGVYREVWTW